MTLYRQIVILVTIVFTILLITIVTISFNIIKDSVQKELYENAQNSVSSLSLSISNTSTSQGNIETMINAIFDNGNYERVTYKDINEQIQYERKLEKKQDNIPIWFENLIMIQIPVAKATLSSNWKIIGTLEILNSKNSAYSQLYNLMTHIFFYLSISCILFLIIIYFILHIILKPLLEIRNQATLALKNEFVIQKNIPKTKEFKIVIKSINAMIKKFESIFKSANEMLSKNRELLYIDDVTNIPNRRYFILKANELLNVENEKSTGSTIIVSICKINMINKIIGYKNTDKFIFEFAQYIKSLVESIEDAIVCRLNGTEIIIMLPRIDVYNSSIFANSIVEYMNNKLRELNLDENNFGINLAISGYDTKYNVSELFGVIDYSLEQAKLLQFGKYFSLTNKAISIGKSKWREYIFNGLNNNDFEIIYRKVIDTTLKQELYKTVSFNLNVNNETYTYGTFIGAVVDLGLLREVYFYVIKKVLFLNECKFNIPVIIQLPTLFLNDIETYEKIKHIFTEIKDKPKCKIIFEISESFINKYYDSSLLYINLFKENGFGFGINSFIADGEDYQYLKELKPLFIKVDKQYIFNMEQNINILKIILESLGVELIATGVSTLKEVNRLCEKDVKIVAGSVVEQY